jgi:hypothetical protein
LAVQKKYVSTYLNTSAPENQLRFFDKPMFKDKDINDRPLFNLADLWLIYKPIWPCSSEERLGEVFDGGKV